MKSGSASIPIALFIIPFAFMIHAASGKDLINSTCRTSALGDPNIDYNFCTTSLQAVPASHSATLYGLGVITVRLIEHNVTDTSSYIKRMMKSRNLDPYVRQCLIACDMFFPMAVSSAEQAMSEYEAKRFDDANVHVSAVLDAATSCEDGFKERRGVVSPLTKRNNDTFQLSAMALSVMHIIQTGSS